MLGFVFETHTLFTNNQVGRDLKPAKVKRKVNGWFPLFARRASLCSPIGDNLNLPY